MSPQPVGLGTGLWDGVELFESWGQRKLQSPVGEGHREVQPIFPILSLGCYR